MKFDKKEYALLPASPGIYLVHLRLAEASLLRIGRFGECIFPAGDYFYAGSAFGPGGLRSRLGRHLRGDGKTRWHIDYLRAVAQVNGFAYQVAGQSPGNSEAALESTQIVATESVLKAIGALPAVLIGEGDFSECGCLQRLAALPEAFFPLAGFGASDCRGGCRAHLVAFPPPEPDHLR